MKWTQKLKSWWGKLFGQEANREDAGSETPDNALSRLREFVYLDTTSLKSLLISLKETIPDSMTERTSHSDEVEVSGRMSAGHELVAKAESGSRLSTASGNDLSVTRMSDVQSMFNELVAIPGIPQDMGAGDTPEQQPSRGDLIEIEVELSAEDIYELSALFREFGGLAKTAPHIMGGAQMLEFLDEVAPVIEMLDRLMVDLIPVRGRAADYVVVQSGSGPVVRKKDDMNEDELKDSQPLFLVGVTEREKFWRDHRRVIFSGTRYKVLARVARDGLHNDWSAVKGADLFYTLAPELKRKLHSIRLPRGEQGNQGNLEITPRQQEFGRVLVAFKREILGEEHRDSWSAAAEQEFETLVEARLGSESSPSSQLAAFDAVRELIEKHVPDVSTMSEEDIAHLRQKARDTLGFGISPAHDSLARVPQEDQSEVEDDWLLDTEIIAIYW